MATKAKDSTIRKDKKVTPSVFNTRQPGNSTTKPVTPGSNAKDKTNPSAKPTPSYLRPTLSSRTEPLAKPQVKKPSNGDAANAQKAQLLRRRSFDRPPTASRTQQTSPDPKRPGSRDKTSTRSSSFSSSRIPSLKPALERNSKSFKPVKSQPPPPASRIMTRIPSFSKKTESRSNSGPSVPSISGTEMLVTETNVQESNAESTSIPEPEEKVSVESEAQSVVSEPEEENQKHSDDVNSVELNNADDNKLQNFENDNISEEQSVPSEVEIKETELQVEYDENQHLAEENQSNIEESNNIVDHQEASVAVEDDHKEQEENVNESADASTAEMEEGQRAEDEIRIDEQTVQEEVKTRTEEEHEPKEEQKVVEEIVEETKETKPAEATSSTPRPQVGQGKKESPAAYNDVIEETKNKLMEKRKNRVKALVGAFETVIDYETAASK